jgi:hypothetical protein
MLAVAALALSGPSAYALTTLHRGNTGALPIAGPLAHAFNHGPPFGPGIGVAQPDAGPAPWQAGARNRGCNLLDAGKPAQAVVDKLNDDASSYTWVAATVGSSCASGYQLASGHPVLPVGGFNGSDPSPRQDVFERLIVAGKIHYFIVVDTGDSADLKDPSVHLNNSGLIQRWVESNFLPTKVGGVMLYDLTR